MTHDHAKSKRAIAWQMAAHELGVEFISPYTFSDNSGQKYIYAGLLSHFGSPKGAIIFSQHDFDTSQEWERVYKVVKEIGYLCSALSPYHYEAYDRDIFIETLNDWGWFGPAGKHPSWFTGGFRVHGGGTDPGSPIRPRE